MVKMLRALALAAVLLLPLSSCDFLIMGLYPSDLGQLTARADLSAGITAAEAASFNLSIVRAGDMEYVLLFSSTAFDGAKNHLYVLSPTLAVLTTYTLNDIAALDPPGSSFAGNAAVTHLVDGRVIIGNVVASPSSAGLTLERKLEPPVNPVNVALMNWAIVGPDTASLTWSGFWVNAGNLSYSAYASDWSTVIQLSHPIGRPYQLQGVFTNPEDANSNLALLVFADYSGTTSTYYFLQVPKDPDLMNAFPGSPLFDTTAYTSTSFKKQNLDGNTIAVTSDGIVAYDYSSGSWTWFTPSAPDAVKSLAVRNRSSSLKSAFSFSAGYYCTWDPGTRILTRYEKWW
ncbi:MAG: hypothetical protein ABSF77_17405 [Spirochaetia bacterium]|jgi:hypothetical protein